MKKMIESSRTSFGSGTPKPLTEGMRLANGKWKNCTRAVVESYKKTHNGKMPPENILATTATVLENTRNQIARMNETTKQMNLGNFVDYGFGIITAVMPALIANEIVSVQPLKARTGEVFYLSYSYGSNKGNVKAGQTAISPFTGPEQNPAYTSEQVPNEYLGMVESATKKFEANLSYGPVVPGSVEVTVGTDVLVDNGLGTLQVKSGTLSLNTAKSKIDYVSGTMVIETTADIPDATTVAAKYNFSYGNQDVGANIPELNIDLGSTTISSVTRSLRARWIFDSAFELQNVHGVNVDDEIAAALAAEIRNEIDGEIMTDLFNQAAAGSSVFTWSKTAPAGVAYVDHKDTFVDLIIRMNNAIFADTKRAEGTFIICGMDVASLIEAIPGRFIPNNEGVKAGPHIIGTLDNRWTIIKNPYYGPRDFVVGHRGNTYLESGYIYAPFLPLYTTQTVMLDDFVNRKGIRTIYGKKLLNPKFYAKGKIVD